MIPSISHQMPALARSITHVKIVLLEVRKPFLGFSAFFIDDMNVLGGLCSFGALTEGVGNVYFSQLDLP
jgi:hypothetical protein